MKFAAFVAPFLFASCYCNDYRTDPECEYIRIPIILSGRVIPAGQIKQLEEMLVAWYEYIAQLNCAAYGGVPRRTAVTWSDEILDCWGTTFYISSLNLDKFQQDIFAQADFRIEKECSCLFSQNIGVLRYWSIENRMELARHIGRNFAPRSTDSPLNTFSANVFDGGFMPPKFNVIDFSPLTCQPVISTVKDAKHSLTNLFVLYAQCALIAYPEALSLFYIVAPYIHSACDRVFCIIPQRFRRKDYRHDPNSNSMYFYRRMPYKFSSILFDVFFEENLQDKEFTTEQKLEFAAQVGARMRTNYDEIHQVDIYKHRTHDMFYKWIPGRTKLKHTCNVS
ncbi:MAG: hypothetical protein LBJ89_04955 [Holosporales bacterium]|jgi:hypothetical protein|nr:hypothetical protein [Holosporales bacterium]